MNLMLAYVILFVAAALEAGGDALVRVGLHSHSSAGRIGLFAAGASLAKAGHPARVRVGRLVRRSLKAGNVPFSVSLTAKGKAALRRHRRLALTVKITLTPLDGAAVTVTRGVVLHA